MRKIIRKLFVDDESQARVEWLLHQRAMAITFQPKRWARRLLRPRCTTLRQFSIGTWVLVLQSSAITSQLHPSWKISYLQLRNSYIFVPLSLPCHSYQEMYIFKLENVLGHILAWSRFLVDLLGKYRKFDQESQFCDKTGSRVTM